MLQVAVGWNGSKYMAPTTIRLTAAASGIIHVMDVADAHCVALEHLHEGTGLRAFNLGTRFRGSPSFN